MGISSSAKRKLRSKLQQIQSAVLAAASYGQSNAELVSMPTAAALQQQHHHQHPSDVLPRGSCTDQQFPGDAPMWHPGMEDGEAGLELCMDSIRLDLLHQRLGVAGTADPSQQLGWYVRILQAFRTGELGKFMLDELPAAAATSGGAAASAAAAAKRCKSLAASG